MTRMLVFRCLLCALALLLFLLGAAPSQPRSVQTAVGDVFEFPIPTADSRSYSLVRSWDGNVWFNAQHKRVGRLGPSGIPEFPIGTPGGINVLKGAPVTLRNKAISSEGSGLSTVPYSPEVLGTVKGNHHESTIGSSARLAAGGHHTCGLTTGGGVQCGGWNEDGQLGDGTTTSRRVPTDVVGFVEAITTIVVGEHHTCVLTTAGGVKCWGNNESGRLGDGTNIHRSNPVDVVGLVNGVVAMAPGEAHTCVLTVAGGVKCWGNNYYGRLGDGTTTNRRTPVSVVGLSNNVAGIAAGSGHTCALTTAGGVKCWGANNNSQLGDGTSLDRYTPVDVVGLSSGVAAIAAGGYHTCALTTSGEVKCWGRNAEGELGDGTSTQRLSPVDVVGLGGGVVVIASHDLHTCALTASSGAKCWGRNHFGQLGDGTTTDRHTPVDVVGLGDGVAAIAPGSNHTCGLTTSGFMKCWGYNGIGQLGDGTTADHHTPGDVLGFGIGLANLTISTDPIELHWLSGTVQTGYTLLKFNTSTASATLLPVAGDLTSYSDASATNGVVYCYVLAALSGPTFLGLSDLLCGMAGAESGTVIPQDFALKLGGTANAAMTWTAPVGGADSYLLQRIPLDGSPITTAALGGAATSTTQAVVSAGTCFQLIAFKGAAYGTSDVLCGVPGVSTLGLEGGAGQGGKARTASEVLAEVEGRFQGVAAGAAMGRP